MLHVSLGIIVFNEEKNILNLLHSVSAQELERVIIDDIIVVSSGSTDKTVDLVADYSEKDKRVSLIVQERREGKASAINEFLESCNNQVVVVTSGDVIFDKKTIESLVSPFMNSSGVGMTSVKPIPINSGVDFMGFVSAMHWKLHRLLKRHGETVAFRKDLINLMPSRVSADEAYVEAITQQKGYRIVQPDGAIVFNKGSECISEFLRQIRRHYVGHLFIKTEFSYVVSSMTVSGIASAAKEIINCLRIDLGSINYVIGYVLLEAAGRFLGIWDFYAKRRDYHVWSMAETTKDLNKTDN